MTPTLARLAATLGPAEASDLWAMVEASIAEGQPPDVEWPDCGIVEQAMQARAVGLAMLDLAAVRWDHAAGRRG